MSDGIVSMKVVGVAAGASTGLKNNPVKLVRKKREMMANGPNFTACRRRNFRGNIIF
jgi:hypothetical protein